MLHKCGGCGGQIQCQSTPPSESSIFYTRVWGRVTLMFVSLLAFIFALVVTSKQYGLVRLDRMLANPDVSYNEFKSSAGDQPDTEKFNKESRSSGVEVEIQRIKTNASDDRKLLQSTIALLQELMKAESPKKGVIGP